MNKQNFYSAYRESLVRAYLWAQDDAKLERFMGSVKGTMEGGAKTWNHDGESVIEAWRSIGGKGKPTLKALRALPEA